MKRRTATTLATVLLAAAFTVQPAAAQAVRSDVEPPNPVTFSGDTVIVAGERFVVPGDNPLIFLNHELLNPDGEDQSVVQSLDTDTIDRVEVLKGEKALETYGPRGALAGVVEIYLKGYEPPQRSPFMEPLKN